MSCFSLFSVFSSLKILFKGIASVECIVIPLMLNATFPMLANFMILAFVGATFGNFFVEYLNMFFYYAQ